MSWILRTGVGRHILPAVRLPQAYFSLPRAAWMAWAVPWDAEFQRVERLEGSAMGEEADEASRFLVPPPWRPEPGSRSDTATRPPVPG